MQVKKKKKKSLYFSVAISLKMNRLQKYLQNCFHVWCTELRSNKMCQQSYTSLSFMHCYCIIISAVIYLLNYIYVIPLHFVLRLLFKIQRHYILHTFISLRSRILSTTIVGHS